MTDAAPAGAGLPVGFRVAPDEDLRRDDDGTLLWGGAPWRLLRLTAAGAARAARLLAGDPVADLADGGLGARLVRGGLAHPLPAPVAETPDLDVVVPVRDRVAALDRCLGSLAGVARVVVVDDGSVDGAAVARVARARAATCVRLDVNRGPAAARNAGLAASTADVVAFVDSDCEVTSAQLRALVGHLADPAVAAVAPRVRPAGVRRSPVAWFAAARSPLDRGRRPGEVRPDGPVSYVPTTCLVVRRAAIDRVGGFDVGLRYGEDVDLCWRLAAAGWAVRYEPRVEVGHDEPAHWPGWLARRFRYGTSAGPLARRHPTRLSGPAAAGLAAPFVIARHARAGRLPPAVARQVAATAPVRTARGFGRWALPVWGPAALALTPSRARVAVLAATAAVLAGEWRRLEAPRPALVPWAVAAAADDAAYGAGVWWGSLQERTLSPVLPRLSAVPLRRSP